MSKHLFSSLVIIALIAQGCSDSDASSGAGTPGPSPGLSQGGAQDFGLFRDILAAGEVPSPEAMDDVGFFNEHKIELPPAECGEDVCAHGLLGVMGNMISGSNCTLVMLGLNTPIDPSTLERPPLNLAIAMDTSGSMSGDNMRYARRGLLRMLETLEPTDRVTLVSYDTDAEILVDHVAGDAEELEAAINTLEAKGSTNIYDGLRVAFERVEAYAEPGVQNRVILLSDGVATSGITNDDRIKRLATSYAERGIGVTSIGMGTEFNVNLMRDVAEAGSGNFYFLESPQAVEEVFTEEIQTFLVPIAEDVTLQFSVADGYSLRAIYGTRLATLGETAGIITIPSLFIAHRTDSEDIEKGRRGGGGAIIVELLPDADAQGVVNPNEVGVVTMQYRVPGTEERRTQTITITSPVLPGETPERGLFDMASVEKAFVMLNVFVGMQLASERATSGDNSGALAVLDALDANLSDWLARNPDPDIADDQRLVQRFQDILVQRGATDPPSTFALPEPWPYD